MLLPLLLPPPLPPLAVGAKSSNAKRSSRSSTTTITRPAGENRAAVRRVRAAATSAMVLGWRSLPPLVWQKI